MEMCTRCKKRVAVVFITRIEGDRTYNEGICMKCAKELGIKPVSDVLEKMGLSDDDIERMEDEMDGIMNLPEVASSDDQSVQEGDNGNGKTPPIDFRRLFGPLMNMGQNPAGAGEAPGAKKPKGEKNHPQKKFLSLYCSDITAKAREGKLDGIVGRDRELERLMQILCRRQKNNPCLIGEPGVGKTAIAEALAQRIVEGRVPYKLSNKEVHLLDLTALVAGTQFRGQFETRMKGLIEEVKTLGNVILVIDEVHSIVGAGDSEGSMNAANILKPALSRGELQVIGATTLAEYRKYIEKDSALERRFQPIVVEESSVADTVKILKGIKGYYEKFHGIKIPDDTVERAVILSERYITDRFLPDKAIDLVDEAAAHLALHSDVISRAEKSADLLKEIRKERDALEAKETKTEEEQTDKYRLLAECRSKELVALEEHNTAVAERDKLCLSVKDLAEVIEVWTGIPSSNITENEFLKIDKLKDRLCSRIVGQDAAVDAVVRAIKRNRAGVSYKRKPVSFIFAGPTGVGKTELVKTLAADLFDSPETLIRLDMSEFMEKFSVSRIIGAPPGYVGYDEAGQLTEKIRRKPYSVVLFDEIEKAHPDVMNILLQILDDGQITDARGKKVNFENTIIVMTTNAGAVGVSATAGFLTGENASQDSGKTDKALAQFLRPEFLNRVDEIITFRSLDKNDFVKIARIMLSDLDKALAEKGISLSFSENAVKTLAEKSFSVKYGARNLRRTIQRDVEDALAQRLISDYNAKITAVSLDADGAGNILIACD
ncbi:MAG: ATP-dependent Clp protease ATP-binding subunit [Clostridia bacterium]|nr:ATP-dependent Clp protease ATP-binding subunit [Clostridia bacterium]